MSAQEHSLPYGPGTYRSNALPDLPPSRQQQGGLFETPLRWGHYAGMDSPVEVDSQLESEAHKAYEQQLAEGQKPLIFCDAHRWRFESSSIIPDLIFISKLLSFFFPWFFFTAEFYFVVDSNLLFSLPPVFLTILTLGLSGRSKQKYADLSLLAGAVVAFLFIAWDKGALCAYWSEHPPLIWIGISLSLHAILGAGLLLAL